MLKEGSPVPVTVTTGVTDGIMTEVVRGVEPGAELVIGIASTKK
jgi:hypothetical protein